MTHDPTMRVLTVLEMLQALERVTGAQLASRLEVHPRTVQRYIARLQDIGVPVMASRGVGGAYFLRPGYRLPPMMFTDDEALALMLGLRALRSLGLSAFAPATEGAGAKLRRALPAALAERVRGVQDALDLDAPWLVEAGAHLVIELATALQARRVVRLSHRARTGQLTRREVEPYGVVRDEGRWYLVGHCRTRGDTRCFRVDRLSEVQTLDERFEAPADFDARAALRASLARGPAQFEVRVWVEAPLQAVQDGLPLVRPALSPWEDGTLVRCAVDDLEAFAAMLLMLGCAVSVEAPGALRAAFERLAQRATHIASGPRPHNP